MTVCPICDSEEYTWKTGCPECGHYDEDGHRLRRRQRRRDERKIRRDRRQFR